MRRSLAAAAAALSLLFSSLPASPQEAADADIDSLFENAEEDKPGNAPEAGASVLDAFVSAKPLSFRGSLTSKAGLLAGLLSWPSSLPRRGDLDLSGYFEFENRISCDARIDRTASFFATVYTEYPGFELGLEEMFFDYSLGEALFFRIGKQKGAWGYGREFDQTDLMMDCENGLAIKCYAPLGAGGLTAVVLDQKAWHPDTEYPGFGGMAYLAKGELVAGKVELLASGRYREAEGGEALLSAKLAVFGIDLFHESMLSLAPSPSDEAAYSTVSGFLWERKGPVSLTLYGEYAYLAPSLPSFLGASGLDGDHRLCLAFLVKGGSLFGRPVKLGARWIHAFADGSGTMLPALAFEPAPNVEATFGVPMLYGGDDSIYVKDSEDPAKRRLSVAMIVSLTLNY